MLSPSQFYKCLADEIRLKSLSLIAVEGELCVCELMVALGETSQPKVSRHLAQLRNSGILVDRKQKQWVFYALNPELPEWMRNTILLQHQHVPELLSEEISRLAAFGDRPERISSCCP